MHGPLESNAGRQLALWAGLTALLIHTGTPHAAWAWQEPGEVIAQDDAGAAIAAQRAARSGTSSRRGYQSPTTAPAETAAPAAAPRAVQPAETPPSRIAKPSVAEPSPASPSPTAEGVAAATSEAIEAEAASFNDVQPGVTTLADLEAAWGPPREISGDAALSEYVYELEPFKHIAVTVEHGTVTSIFIVLEHALSADLLAKELQLTDIESVLVLDEVGQPLGEVFPERGVLFSYTSGRQQGQVARIIVETITAEPFVRRAETRLENRYDAALADLDFALQLEPDSGRAHWMRAQLMSDTGNHDLALQSIERALAAEPGEALYRLTRAKILGQADEFDEAFQECETLLDQRDLAPEIRARAHAQWGDLIAAGPERDYKRAMEEHVKAIKIARPLVDDRRVAVRRAAKEVLVSAHLAVARDIAWGSWNRKGEVVPKWIEQADEIASAAIEAGDAPGDYRFRICQQALAAYVGMQGAADPSYWAKETLRTGRALIDSTDDPMYKSRLQWELGMTLYDAVQVYHMRRQYPQALEYGPLAITYLEAAAQDRQPVPGQAYLMGRLYFRLGSIHLAHHRDHQRALPWFSKAVPLMEQPIPDSALADIGRQGETFVSMAVSYWETGQRDEAVRLTSQGVRLMEKAVDAGILQPEALTIAYGNLSAMYDELGEVDQARNYDEMAAQIEQTLKR